MDEKTSAIIERGLAFLASRQNDDGTFGSGNARNNPGVIALAGMAFVSAGNTPTRGKYAENVERSLRFLLDHTQESGYVAHPQSGLHGPMYGHGFATLFLAEVYGMSPSPELRDKLAKAVRLIVNTQNTEGGWRYYPERKDADVSVTVCQIMALRSARNAGIYVPNETIDRCIEYIKRAQNPDGGFMYQLQQPGESAFARSAAGIVALYSAGIYEGEEIRRGLEYIGKHPPRGDGLSRDQYYYYGHYYAVQAMWHVGGEEWINWYQAIRDELVAREIRGGGWLDMIGPEYATAMACLVLQTPSSYLPIFQR